MIDKHFKPWLIEVNQSPSFKTDSALDYDIKKNVVKDAFSLLNCNQERRQEFIDEKKRQAELRILTGKQDKMDPEAKKQQKQKRLEDRFEFEQKVLRCGGGNGY
jgi:hypothetical protein